MTIASFESFIEHLEVPAACKLDKPVYKKLFLDSGVLDAADKQCLKNDIARISWRYTLKPSTINISAYRDDLREYPEVAILHVELSDPARMGRIAHFINRSIPYPLVLLFTVDNENLALSLADKRINQADKEKWVLEDEVSSGWISLADASDIEAEFLVSLKVTALPFTDFWSFYQALMDRVIALNCACHNGVFQLEPGAPSKSSKNRLEGLRELEKLNSQKSELANKLKKEKQMGKLVELNTKVKKINDKIDEIKANL